MFHLNVQNNNDDI